MHFLFDFASKVEQPPTISWSLIVVAHVIKKAVILLLFTQNPCVCTIFVVPLHPQRFYNLPAGTDSVKKR